MDSTEREPRPKAEIRRFDVFAEYKRQEALKEGRPPDEAKGYGLWVAKVVASRRFGPSAAKRRVDGDARAGEPKADERAKEEPRFHALGDELQTDELFDREIVRRMGEEFYREVFEPAIAERFEQGDRYESIRDVIRKSWNRRE